AARAGPGASGRAGRAAAASARRPAAAPPAGAVARRWRAPWTESLFSLAFAVEVALDRGAVARQHDAGGGRPSAGAGAGQGAGVGRPPVALARRWTRRDAGDAGVLQVLHGAGRQGLLLELEAVRGGLVAEGQLGRAGPAGDATPAGLLALRQAVVQAPL